MNEVAPQDAPANSAQPPAPASGDADQRDGAHQQSTRGDGSLPSSAGIAGLPLLRARRDGWTAARQALFLDALAGGSGVAAAAKTAGMSRESASRLRRNPRANGFAERWAAIEAAPVVALDFAAMLYDARHDTLHSSRTRWLDSRAAKPRFDSWLVARLVARLAALENRRLKD